MKRKRFSESQIVAILQEGEAGVSVPELSRKYGFAESTYYVWKSKYEGMSIKELKRLKQLEEENQRLKKMYANLSMDHELLKEVLEKKLGVGVNVENWRET